MKELLKAIRATKRICVDEGVALDAPLAGEIFKAIQHSNVELDDQGRELPPVKIVKTADGKYVTVGGDTRS
jgi:hypothetical protein